MAGVVTRRRAAKLLKPHLTTLGALALAADQAVAAFSPKLFVSPSSHHYRSKLDGLLVTALWTESVRELASNTGMNVRVGGVEVCSPFGWVELVVGGVLHVRLVRDDMRAPTSTRQRARATQTVSADQLAIPGITPAQVTAVDLAAHLNSAGRITSMAARAPSGAGSLWAPIPVDMPRARARAWSWKELKKPWLATVDRAHQLAGFELLETLTKQVEDKDKEIANLNELIRSLQSVDVPADAATNVRPHWTIPTNPAASSADTEGA